MSETDNASTTAEPQSTAVSVVDPKPKPPRLISTSDVAIWDTAALDHMGRVGRLMADSGLASETIFKDGDQPAADHTVVARMVMIANLARECAANPLMFLQGCSIISRKLHLEGKVVNAIIRARTGVVLRFTFGVWDTDHIEFPPMIPQLDPAGEQMVGLDGKPLFIADPAFFHNVGERLAVRVSDPDDPERFVDGSVGLWKTDRKGSPWTAQGNWRRQLRYRGAPEWARAYEPGAVLGFYSDADEDLDPIEPTVRGPKPKRDLAAKLSNETHGGEHGAEGFNREGIAESLNGGAMAEEVPHNPETGEVLDAQFEDKGADVAAEGANAADEAQIGHDMEEDEEEGVFSADVMAAAAQLATISPLDEEVEVIASRLAAAEENGEAITMGHAEAGEKYVIGGEGTNPEGRRCVYKDGARFSTAKDVSKLKAYAIHAEAPEADENPTSPADATVTDGAQTVAAEPASSASATPAPSATAAANSSPGSTGAASDAGEDTTLLGRMSRMTSWAEIKAAWAEMNRTTDWMAASEADKDDLRRAVWEQVLRVKAEHKDPVDHATDPSAFGIWLATQYGKDGAEAAIGTLDVLRNQAIWEKMPQASRDTLQARATARAKCAAPS
jgi:hypothetical protein